MDMHLSVLVRLLLVIVPSCGKLTMMAGVYSCVGKNLALMEMRILTAILLTRFDVGFAPGENGEELFKHFLDHFTSDAGPLRLTFKERGLSGQ